MVGYAHKEAQEKMGATWVDEFSTMVYTHFIVSGLTVFGGFVFLSVVSLALYHAHLICVGETTNENVCCITIFYSFLFSCFSFSFFFSFVVTSWYFYIAHIIYYNYSA